MRLPDTQARETQEEVLTGFPSVLLVIKVKANDHIIFLAYDSDICHRTAETNDLCPAKMDVDCPRKPHSLVDSNKDNACDHPTPEFVPMTPAGSNVQNSTNQMRDLEEFVASPKDHSLRAEHGNEGNKECGQAAENSVHVREEKVVHVG
jgi:hypothetical protein